MAQGKAARPCSVVHHRNSCYLAYVRLRSWSPLVLYSFFVRGRFSSQDKCEVRSKTM